MKVISVLLLISDMRAAHYSFETLNWILLNVKHKTYSTDRESILHLKHAVNRRISNNFLLIAENLEPNRIMCSAQLPQWFSPEKEPLKPINLAW